MLITIVDSEHTLLLSNEMLYELARVLRYPRLQAFFDLPKTSFTITSLSYAILRKLWR
jgi:hypothetical protein